MKLCIIKKRKGRKYETGAIAKEVLGIELFYDDRGKPHARQENSGGRVFVSVSDTGAYHALMTASSPCGLDIEEEGRKVLPASAARLHPLEQAYLSGLNPGSSEWNREFLSIWVRKEAYMKFCGAGLSMGLASFSVLDEHLDYAGKVQGKEYAPAFMAQTELPGLICAMCTGEHETLEGTVNADFPGEAEKSAMEAAAKMLALRIRSEAEMAGKLASQAYGPEEIESCIRELKQRGYLDDDAYAKTFARAQAEKGRGKRYIILELQKRGVDPAPAMAVLAEGEGEIPGEMERAKARAEKMLENGRAPDGKMLGRIGRRLSSLGFEANVIHAVLSGLRRDKDE